ncbi:MAG TPA: hypothetical protein VIF32_10980 [Gemmatimonadaceae bacterium]
MPILTRRQFLFWASSAVPIALVARRADALAAAWIADDANTLHALGEAILPSAIGRDGVARVVRDFQRWIDNYREHAEIVHGYGTSALRFTRPSPRAKWALQIEQLGRRTSDAGRRRGFASLSPESRRSIIAQELKDEGLDRMPDVASAPHVAIGLLAFFYGTSDAADLAYEAKIGREQCRPLAASPRKPLPIAGARA